MKMCPLLSLLGLLLASLDGCDLSAAHERCCFLSFPVKTARDLLLDMQHFLAHRLRLSQEAGSARRRPRS
jgi:hypothetical protein